MYLFNRRVQRKKKRYAFLRLMVKLAIFVAVVVLIWLYLRRPHVRINDNGAILVPTANDEPPKKHIKEPTFEMDLPGDWTEYVRREKPVHVISWKGTTKESTARTIDIYVDTVPATLAINRVLPVTGQEDRLGVDLASENCITFNQETLKLSPQAAAKLKPIEVTWQGTKFICDIPNSLRNVVGIGSPDGINEVKLTGVREGVHKYFIVYTDASAHPDEKTFPDVLRSLRAI